MNSWLPSMRWPERSATARALEIASVSPISVSASAIGASSRQVPGEKSGSDSGGHGRRQRADRRDAARRRRAPARRRTTLPTTMPSACRARAAAAASRRPAPRPASRRRRRRVHGSTSRDVRGEVAERADEARLLRHVEAEEVAQLRADDQQAGAGGEADDDRGGDEVDERAEPREPRPSLIRPIMRFSVSTQRDVAGENGAASAPTWRTPSATSRWSGRRRGATTSPTARRRSPAASRRRGRIRGGMPGERGEGDALRQHDHAPSRPATRSARSVSRVTRWRQARNGKSLSASGGIGDEGAAAAPR